MALQVEEVSGFSVQVSVVYFSSLTPASSNARRKDY
jgi:hypothetical protein